MTSASTSPRTSSNTPACGGVKRYRPAAAIQLAERGWLPDSLLRWAMRRICAQRLREEHADDPVLFTARQQDYLAQWRNGPLAIATVDANVQHYELPAAFFATVLGKHLKYSCAYWPGNVESLDQAEAAMLDLSCTRAQLADGMDILELGCGWGSLTFWMAREYPNARITAVSNSAAQRQYIEQQAAERGLTNIRVITIDINQFECDQRFDRVVSIEMFEHLRNHAELFGRIRGWLKQDGRLFTHVFCHRELAYPYEVQGETDWMAQYFFTGGIMPSYGLFLNYQQDLELVNRWWLGGEHYEKTSNAWLERQDAARGDLVALFAEHYPAHEASLWFGRWRMFFMAVAELFGYEQGRQWGVGHYLFRPR